MPTSLLLVSHEASMTGAPKVALDLLETFDDVESTIWHRWGGARRPALDAAADHHVVQPLNRVRSTLYSRRGRGRPYARRLAKAIDRASIDWTLRTQRPDVVWCNTIVTIRVALHAAQRGIPTVLHVHEQAEYVREALSFTDWTDRRLAEHLHFVAASDEVAAILTAHTGGTIRTHVLNSCIDVAQVRASGGDPPAHDGLRVLACGRANHGKGFDLYVEAARGIPTIGDTPVTWQWAGHVDPGLDPGPLELLGELPNAAPAIAASDVFVLPSRADTFPLVVLEAMALGRPVVATDLPGPRQQLGPAGTIVDASSEGIADGVRTLLGQPAVAAERARVGLDLVESRWDLGAFRANARSILAHVEGLSPEQPQG